jgi:hypothetical protein
MSTLDFWNANRKVSNGKHYCNHVADPGVCCPKGHNIHALECTCWVENETYEDAERVLQGIRERHAITNSRRLFGILPKHDISLNGKWAMCHLKAGGGPFGDDGICCICKKLVWY